MKARFAEIAANLDAREPKERVLLTVAAVLVVVMAWFEFGIDPLQQERRMLQATATSTLARAAEADAMAAQIVEAAQRDPNVPLRERLAAAERDLETFETEIRDRAGELIPPRQIPSILRSVLERTRGLSFVALEGLGVQPLLAAEDGAAAPAANAFRHGFRVRFRGSYHDTIAYLRSLEALDWRFFWDSIELEVSAHPQAEVAVVVYTLSLDERWIGV